MGQNPTYPGLSETIKIVEKQMRGEQVEHEIEENDETDEIDEEDEFWS